MKLRRIVLTGLLIVMLAATNVATVFGQVPPRPSTPAGPEFRANATVTNSQQTHTETPRAVAMDAVGNFVIVWTGYQQDPDGNIHAQRFNAAGQPQGSEIPVNTTLAGEQLYAAVAMDPDGNFVVTWASYQGADGDVYARWFDASGAAQTAELRVNATTTGEQLYAVPAYSTGPAATRQVVITWTGYQSGDADVYAQRFNPAGQPQGPELRANTTLTGDQYYSSVASAATGDFVVAWSSTQSGNGDVYAQRFNAAGQPQGPELRVNTNLTGEQLYASAAMDALGNFVVVWSGNQLGDYDVYGQRYNAAGQAQGGEFRISPNSGSLYSTVAMDADGDFAVSWTFYPPPGTDSEIRARRYDRLGNAQDSPDLPVNTTTTGLQQYSSVAMDAGSRFVVVWTGDQTGDYDVYGRRYTYAGSVGSPFDVNGDRKADAGIFRPSNPQGPLWYVPWTGGGGQLQIWFGQQGDLPVMADYDGDGGADATIWRPSDGLWYGVNQAGTRVIQQRWGQNGDVPVPCDYDGDNKADLVVYRNGTYLGPLSGGAFFNQVRGVQGDVPVYGDVNRDGTCDAGVFRPSNPQGPLWYVPWTGGGGQLQIYFGQQGDRPVMADYDGDGSDDATIWRPTSGLWYGVNQAGAVVVQQLWGQQGDVPVPADYDGDREADLITYRNGTFLGPQTGGTFLNAARGAAGDLPVSKRQP